MYILYVLYIMYILQKPTEQYMYKPSTMTDTGPSQPKTH